MFYHYNDIMENGRYDLADDIRIAGEDMTKSIQEISDARKGVRELRGIRKRFLLPGRKRRKERRLKI